MTTGDTPMQAVPDEVKAIGKFAYDIAEQLKSGSTALDREVQALFSTWKGSAADGYRAGWDEMQDGAMQAWDALTELAAKLGVSAATLRERDETNASAISSLRLD
ncbi:WXG100 family type VII secretion target [Nocardia vulneris]|uniref:WXG100 family type VII secretion target n=1 Tax=Nocardia vulneris TaxID=1141657 RepID=UPI0030D41819